MSFDALLRASGRTATDISAQIGVSQATLTKLRKGQRGASFEMLEYVRAAFGVTPAALFDPDAALGQLGLQRLEADTSAPERHTFVATGTTDQLALRPPTESGGQAVHNDPELLAALVRYWDGLSTEQRLELVGHSNRLRMAGTSDATPATAGFRRG